MKNTITVAVVAAIVSSGSAHAYNEAIYDQNAHSLHIPKVIVDGQYYDVNFQQDEGLTFSVTSIVPSPSASSANIATYNTAARSLAIPAVIVGADTYSANMLQGNGLSFSVTNTTLIDSYFEPIDVFDLNNHHAGGSRSSSVNTTKGGGQSCGYASLLSRAEMGQRLQQAGGSVTLSNLTEWCGTLAGQTACMKGFGKLLVTTEPYSSTGQVVTLYMTELLPNHWTEVEFDNLGFNNKPTTNISAVNSDASVLDGAACSFSSLPVLSKEFINGEWIGYKATYSLSSTVGSTSLATASCFNQVCTVNTSSDVISINLSSFNLVSRYGSPASGGVWTTASGASQLAGATMTGDRQLLSMFICNTPLDQAKTFDNCSFFTFKR